MNRMLFAALLATLLGVGCDFPTTWQGVQSATKDVIPSAVGPSADTITIATYNIQVFGLAKEQNPHAFERLAEIIRRYDVVAVQEIRCLDPEFLDRFLAVVNATGRKYEYAIGPRLGRSVSKEQYAFLFDSDQLELARQTIYTVDDRYDWLHREPFVARFRAKTEDGKSGFTFTLVNIHTDPDEVEHEINSLDDVLQAVGTDGSGEDDVILLGDLNAAPSRFGELGRLPGLRMVISSELTNTRRTETYDNILFDGRRTTEFTGEGGVLDVERELRLTRDEALELSDHLPVWARFTRTEAGPAVLAGSGTERH